MTSADTTVLSATRSRRGSGGRKLVRTIFHYVPWFAYLLIVYVAVKLGVPDVRTPFYVSASGAFAVSWVEVLYVLASIIAMAEMLRVARPGENRVVEALWMLGVGVFYLFLFVLSSRNGFTYIFKTTEFLVLTLIGVAQGIIGIVLNSRTLKRSSDISLADSSEHH
jgi:hypothetical protein